MTDIYKRLAERLDQIPNGYPATESGVELKILKKIFTPEEAETALRLNLFPEPVEAIAGRLEKPVEEMRTILDTMAGKGQISCRKMLGQQVYMPVPFIVGIYEFQLYRIDKEMAEYIEEYLPALFETLGKYKPAVSRVLPINAKIEARSRVKSYDDVRQLIEGSKSFQINECICRKEKALLGDPCRHDLETCLWISKEENAWEYFSLGGRIISKEEALKVLDDAREAGLIHNLFYNTQETHSAICNCCSCCCGIFRGVNELGLPNLLVRSNYVARIDQESCSACGVCADERCPVNAISVENGKYTVMADVCIGCGSCSVACPDWSISLMERAESEREQPPKDIIDWMVQRAQNRGVELKFD
jgi:Fe-S-cluster-containing hydrogenase component 2